MYTITTLVMSFSVALVLGRDIVPLVNKKFEYPDGIPYRVDTDQNQPRGDQLGYNICNSTTEGPSSMCQTAIFNSLDDFCIWAPPNSNHTVGEIEGEMVAWCTKPGHGTRIIPPGTITGVQLTRTPDYVQVVGFMDQTKINMLSADAGGEMDPHGADGRGNPMGGLLFTNAFSGKYTQVIEWHNFMGSNKFCLKACDQTQPNAQRYCEHIFDRIGCEYNAPSNARDGVFESCASDSQDFPGVYTDASGKTQTYTQPPEGVAGGDVASIPYTPRVPASSSCSQFRSAEIYAARGATVPVPILNVAVTPTFTSSITPSSYSAPHSPPNPTYAYSSEAFHASASPPPYPLNPSITRYGSSFVASAGVIIPNAKPIFSPTSTYPSTQSPTPVPTSRFSISPTPISVYSSSSTRASTTFESTTFVSSSLSAGVTSTTSSTSNSTSVTTSTPSSESRTDSAAALSSGPAEGSAASNLRYIWLNHPGALCVTAVAFLGYFLQ